MVFVSIPGQLKLELRQAEPILIYPALQHFKILCLLMSTFLQPEVISNPLA